MSSLDLLLQDLLRPDSERPAHESMAQWHTFYQRLTADYDHLIDHSILGGRHSDSVGYAFAAGYQAAIRHLFGESEPHIASLCVTEASGNHPRSIETTLSSNAQGQLIVSGNKTFISGAKDAQLMFVACKDMREGSGIDAQGRPLIKVVRMPVSGDQITITEMPDLGFLSEISHGSVSLNSVCVEEENILPGDGYIQYVKAFRSYEDLHVLTALTSYRLGEAATHQWPLSVQEAHIELLLALRQLSLMDLNSSSAHIALSGSRNRLLSLIEATDSYFESTNEAAFKRWQRDKRLLSVANKAQLKRTETAWKTLGS